MDEINLYELLKTTGLPVAYHHYNSPPEPSYLVYFFRSSDDLAADNINYIPINNYQLELYTGIKDLQTERRIEVCLTAADIYFSKQEIYINSERLYQVVYEIQI